ncbi:MAG: CRISPR-associated helicase Cas3' [Rhodobacteraceae bacterium]|jgi:CRISPR-associated endonuclease/helicase Cas3|nr:CRISPR-associated helicase Cas3' [Paracoccaceae bacterium]
MALLDWPGKSPVERGLQSHPAVYHMLDVAAVAERLIEPSCFDPALKDALVLLVALHDLGKVSESFRRMLEDGVPQTFRHWELTEVLLFEADGSLGERLGNEPWIRQMLYAAVSGHHGRPSKRDVGGLATQGKRPRDYRRALEAVGAGRHDALRTVLAFCDLWPDASLVRLDDEQAVALSWWLPGLCTAADWIGSNTRWFPPEAAGTCIVDYLNRARKSASAAVVGAGLAGAATNRTELFDFQLRPMQSACAGVSLTPGPMLAIIEDETGAGKTEAALILAQRMLLAGKGRGLFVALPTMATADAMFRRTVQVVGKLFGMGATLTLAHGRAGLSVDFRDIVDAAVKSEDDATCSQWLSESRRRALLADVGVGTIDQALLAVLPVKFQTLRHFGLSSKILIVDEVHELGEPYIGAELEALLRMHKAAGGSAILLTATLPMAQRARLLSVYGGSSDSRAYPALTVAGGTAVTDLPGPNGSKKGAITVERLEHPDAAVALLTARAHHGAACVWVRNAVDDAIAAVDALREAGVEAILLHARFALSDRKRIEAEILARAGKGRGDWTGPVVVGTQVLEASLDLDFDVMVSDLAPMAALIQRAGRMWRHMDIRPASSRPVAAPILHVLSPDPGVVADDRWLHAVLDRGAYVYSIADQWRTARVLTDVAQIESPSGLRALIEAVHGADAVPIPDVLQGAEFAIEGMGAAARGHAAQNIVDLSAGYRMGGRADDDARYPTRLGEEQRVLVLARERNGVLRPWAEAERDGWPLSEVSARRSRLDALPLPDQSAPEIVAITRDWPDWKRAEYRLCPVAADGTICQDLRYDADRGLIFGDRR